MPLDESEADSICNKRLDAYPYIYLIIQIGTKSRSLTKPDLTKPARFDTNQRTIISMQLLNQYLVKLCVIKYVSYICATV
jgi:hypothetical protein